jgi:16S rRNA (guanine966-N2)-methyltransferase
MFNLIESRLDLDNATVLDLFAGSGALGLEAISRGACHVTFVENDREAVKAIYSNVRELDVKEDCTILSLEVAGFLKSRTGVQFDLIVADPPYQYPLFKELVTSALRLVKNDGLLVLEHGKSAHFGEQDRRINCSRRYGRTNVTIFT